MDGFTELGALIKIRTTFYTFKYHLTFTQNYILSEIVATAAPHIHIRRQVG